MSITADVSVAEGLRAVADFFENNPALRSGSTIQVSCRTASDLELLERTFIDAVGRAEKDTMGAYVRVSATFGGITLWGAVERDVAWPSPIAVEDQPVEDAVLGGVV